MLNKQGFMELRCAAKDQDEEHLITRLKSSYVYDDHDQAAVQFQTVPEIHKEEENLEKDLTFFVPDEHSETGDHHHHVINDFSDSDNQYYLRNNHDRQKRRRVKIFSDDESEGFPREVPTVTRKGFKRRRRDEVVSNKMRKLHKLLPNCHKEDTVSVLDKAIEYTKDLQLQLQVMSIMGMNPYIAQATLNFGMHNHLFTAMAHGINLASQTTSSRFRVSHWPLPPFSNLSFPHTSNQFLFPTTALPASSTQCLCGLVPCFPSTLDFSPPMMGGRHM